MVYDFLMSIPLERVHHYRLDTSRAAVP